MSGPVVARWRDWSGQGLEHLVLEMRADHIRVESTIIATTEAGNPFGLRYRIVCDPSWRTRELEVSLIGGARQIALRGDGAGRWIEGSASPLPALNGAIDVDLSATPFTNTLPIRRLRLRSGESMDIVVVYVEVPSLALTTAPQRYTCIEPRRRYRFQSLDSGFVRDIDIDEHGLVTEYPGLFKRLQVGFENLKEI